MLSRCPLSTSTLAGAAQPLQRLKLPNHHSMAEPSPGAPAAARCKALLAAQHAPGLLSAKPPWLASTLWLCCSMAYEPFGGLKSTTKAVRAGKARHSVKIEYRTPVQQETAQQAETAVQEVERQAVDLELLYFAFDILYYDGQARCSAPSQQPVSVVVSARVSVVAGSACPRSGLACKVDASCLRHEAVSSTA